MIKGINQSRLNDLWLEAEPVRPEVFFNNVVSNDYFVVLHIRNIFWQRVGLFDPSNAGVSAPQLIYWDWVFYSNSSAYNDSDIVYSGGGWSTSTLNSIVHNKSDTWGSVATITTPVTTAPIVHVYRISNGGLAKVEVDGDTANANACLDAQWMVDQGWYPNTILVANGGVLNPTDKVIECSDTGIPAAGSQALVLATGLASSAHTVVLRPTGYQRNGPSLTGGRLYLQGFGTSADPTNATVGDDTVEWIHKAGLTDIRQSSAASSTAVEYAINYFTGANSGEWAGSSHGEETLTSMTLEVSTDHKVVLRKETQLTHPDTGATTHIDVTTLYTFDRSGFRIECRFEATSAITIDTAYLIMQAMFHAVSGSGSIDRVHLDKSVSSDSNTELTISASTGAATDIGRSNIIAQLESAGQLYLISKVDGLDDVLHSNEQAFMDDDDQDKGHAEINMNKVYFPLTDATGVAYSSGTVFNSTVTHRLGVAGNGATANSLYNSLSTGGNGGAPRAARILHPGKLS